MTIAAAAGLSLLAGCSTTDSAPAVTRTVTAAAAPSAAATPAASPSAAQSTAAAPPTTSPTSSTASASPIASPARVDSNAPAGQCRDAALKVSVQNDPEAAGAGQRGAFIVFHNISSSSCNLEGTPGLSLVGRGNGTQIGQPAQRNTSGTKLVSIKPDGTALAQVQYTYVDKSGGNFNDGNGHDIACDAVPADGYRVYPPHSYRASFTAVKTYACSTDVHWITVSAVRPANEYAYFTPAA